MGEASNLLVMMPMTLGGRQRQLAIASAALEQRQARHSLPKAQRRLPTHATPSSGCLELKGNPKLKLPWLAELSVRRGDPGGGGGFRLLITNDKQAAKAQERKGMRSLGSKAACFYIRRKFLFASSSSSSLLLLPLSLSLSHCSIPPVSAGLSSFL